MKRTFLKGAIVGSVFTVAISVTAVAFAGTGVGGVFNLGQKNTVNATTTLTGSSAGTALNVNNRGTGSAVNLKSAAGLAATFSTASGAAPFAVTSSAEVANLDSALLGGQPSSAYQLHSAIHLVQGTPVAVAAGSDGTAFAGCASTEVAIAGGVRWDPVTFPATGLTIEMEGPSARSDGTVGSWRVDGHNGTASSEDLIAYALCINE